MTGNEVDGSSDDINMKKDVHYALVLKIQDQFEVSWIKNYN